MSFYVYVVNCADNTWYTGFTTSVPDRVAAHNEGRGAKYTKTRRPVKLLAFAEFDTKREALQAEYYFKRLTRSQKEDLLQKASTTSFSDELASLIRKVSPKASQKEGA